MAEELTSSMRDTIRSAAKSLRGFRRRQFQAEMAIKYCRGSARRAENVFGWGQPPCCPSWCATATDRSGQRTGDQPFTHPVHETDGRVLRPASADFGVGVLSALSQQVQPDRTLLGNSGKPLERDAVDFDPDGIELGPNHDVARCNPDRALAG